MNINKKEKMNEIKHSICSYLKKNNIDHSELVFKVNDGDGDSIGKMIFEGTDLFYILNLYDIHGDTTYSVKHSYIIQDNLESINVWYELENQCVAIFHSMR